MNVLLEAPPSEQSVHVAVRMPMPLQLLSCCFAGHAMHGNEHQSHGTLAGSRTAYQTCNGAVEGSSHGLSMSVTAWPSYALSGVRDGWKTCVKRGEARRAMVMSGCMLARTISTRVRSALEPLPSTYRAARGRCS